MNDRAGRLAEVVRAVVHEARVERITFMAGSIAYHAFLSILPLLLLVLVVFPLLGFFAFPAEIGIAAGGIFLLGAIAVLGGVAYTVVLSALGGVLGVYVKDEL